MCFLETVQGEYQNSDQRAVTSCGQHTLAGAGAGFRVSVCFLGALSFRGPSLPGCHGEHLTRGWQVPFLIV